MIGFSQRLLCGKNEQCGSEREQSQGVDIRETKVQTAAPLLVQHPKSQARCRNSLCFPSDAAVCRRLYSANDWRRAQWIGHDRRDDNTNISCGQLRVKAVSCANAIVRGTNQLPLQPRASTTRAPAPAGATHRSHICEGAPLLTSQAVD